MSSAERSIATRGYRTVEAPEVSRDAFLEVDRLAFAATPDPPPEAVPPPLDWTRAMAVEARDGSLAAVHASFPFALPVPGAGGAAPTVRCSGLTWVGVRPDHRRRGLLSSMISTHFERSLARSEPVSALFAAETAIYGRFGYGSAAQDLRLTMSRGAALREVAGSADLELRLESADAGTHDELVHGVHHAAGAGRPGWIERTTKELRTQHLADPPSRRDGAEALRIVSVRDATGFRGYALFRRAEKWVDGVPHGVVRVADLAAVDGAAAHRLWSFLLDLDLMTTVQSPMLAVDDPLLQLLLDPRGARPRVTDNLWIRLLDLPAALAARRYAGPIDVVLDVADELLPANRGRWRLRATAGSVEGGVERGVDRDGDPVAVERTSAPADLSLDIRELGAAYLGGRSLAALASAGLVVEHREGTLARASIAFGSTIAPVCSWGF